MLYVPEINRKNNEKTESQLMSLYRPKTISNELCRPTEKTNRKVNSKSKFYWKLKSIFKKILFNLYNFVNRSVFLVYLLINYIYH